MRRRTSDKDNDEKGQSCQKVKMENSSNLFCNQGQELKYLEMEKRGLHVTQAILKVLTRI